MSFTESEKFGYCQIAVPDPPPRSTVLIQNIKEVDVYDEIWVRTQYDGKDLMSVEEIYYYDDDGDEQVFQKATNLCIDIVTCADQGSDLWSWLEDQIAERLRASGIEFREICFDR